MNHRELHERHRRVMPSWLTLYYDAPIALVSGEGRHVTDAEGRRYLDFFGGILTTMIGHAVPEVVEAIRDQAGRMVHTSTLYLIEQQIELAERIAALSGVPDAKVFFTSSGTEATEAALLFTTLARGGNQVLALRGAYHGRSYGAMGVGAVRSWTASGLTPLAVRHVRSGYRYRSPFPGASDSEYAAIGVADLRELLDTAVSGTPACLIAEPVQGVAGFVVPPRGYLAALAAVAAEHGIPWVSDEVQTGWGRTGEAFWGAGAEGLRPDMITFAKGIGNGLALGGVVARADLVDTVAGQSLSTFGGNPLATRAALATLDVLVRDDLQTNALKIGARLLDGLRAAAADLGVVGDVRGRGLMIGIELVRPGSIEPAPDAALRVLEETRAGGLLVGRGGLYGNVIRIAPPLSVTEAEADEGLAVLAAALATADRHAPAPR